MSYPSILDEPDSSAPPAGGGPSRPSGPRLLVVVAIAVVAVGIAFAVVHFYAGEKDDSAPAAEFPTSTAAPIPPPALIGTFGGTNVASGGGREWVTIGIDRVLEAKGETRFRYRLLRGGSMSGEDGEGSYDPRTGQVSFGAGGSMFSGRLARESDGQIVLMASDPTRGFAVRLHHQ